MKADLHPKATEINVSCSCGKSFKILSTLDNDLQIEICSHCHPFYTGKQKIIDTAGRVDQFNKRYKSAATASTADTANKEEKTEK